MSNNSHFDKKVSVLSDSRQSLEGAANVLPSVFIDWFSASQFHPQGGLPLYVSGVSAIFDVDGNCTFERACATGLSGSFESSVRVLCDGYRVSLSGNVGRFNRQDNLFNFGFVETVRRANAILASLDLPPFSTGEGKASYVAGGDGNRRDMCIRGAVVSRLDITCNYSAGSDAQARAVIRWLAGRSIARKKRGYSGDESVWWANTWTMLKAYRKGAEMRAHRGDQELIQWADDCGLVRVELELKKRQLSEIGLSHLGDITDEKLQAVFEEHTEPFRRIDSSDEPDILVSIPSRSRAYASAWLGGQDVRLLCSQATLYRHAKVLRGYGLDILEPRNIERFPVKVRVIDLVPLEVPDWYLKKVAA